MDSKSRDGARGRLAPGTGGAGLAARASSRIMAAAFSAIMSVGALVLPEVIVGITEASATRRPRRPRRRRRGSTTAPASAPKRQVATGWKMVVPMRPAASSSPAWSSTDTPGRYSSGRKRAIACVPTIRRVSRMASAATRRSPGVER